MAADVDTSFNHPTYVEARFGYLCTDDGVLKQVRTWYLADDLVSDGARDVVPQAVAGNNLHAQLVSSNVVRLVRGPVKEGYCLVG